MNDRIESIGSILKNVMPVTYTTAEAPSLTELSPSVVVSTNTISISQKHYIPLPNNFLNFILDIFPGTTIRRNDLSLSVEDGQEIYVWKMESPKGIVTVSLPKMFVEEKDSKGRYDKIPSLESIKTSFLTAIAMAFEQCSKTIEYTLGEKLERLGYNKSRLGRGGEIYHDTDRIERALFGLAIHYKGKGENPPEHMRHFYSALDIIPGKGKGGKGTLYRATLTNIDGIDFGTNKVIPPFTKIPFDLIANRTMTHYEKSLRMKLQQFTDLPEFSPYGETLLEMTDAPKSLLKRLAFRNRMYLMALRVLDEMGFKSKKTDRNKEPLDFRKWRLYFTPPQSKRIKGKEFVQIGPGAEDFINKFLEWQGRAVHYGRQGIQLTPDQIRSRIINTIRAYGFEEVRGIFNAVQRTSEPSPKNFWNSIQELKRRRGSIH